MALYKLVLEEWIPNVGYVEVLADTIQIGTSTELVTNETKEFKGKFREFIRNQPLY